MRQGGPKKLLIYLDQNFVSDMAKLGDDRRVRDDIEQLFNVLHAGFIGEKLVVLRSSFHEVESSLAGTLRDPIRRLQAMLGHAAVREPYEIRKRQIERALLRFLDRSNVGNVIQHRDAFRVDPDQRVTHLDIDVNMDWRFAGAQGKREGLAGQLDALRQRIKDDSITFERQYRTELEWTRNDLLGRGKVSYYTRVYEITEDEWRGFVLSDHFAHVPAIHLDVALMAKLLTAHKNRVIKRGDVTDLDAMATYLPYCDLYATDKLAANVARQLNIPATYSCQVFDAGSAEVRRLLVHLNEALPTLEPVNRPALSIFVAPHPNIKEHSFAFFQTLGQQAKYAEQSGHWVELFGFNDGRMPRYQLRGVPDIEAPFFGLQEVRAIPCQKSDTHEELLKLCRHRCRSPYFLLIDRYQHLPKDFTRQALDSFLTGAQDVLGYTLYSHDVVGRRKTQAVEPLSENL